MNRAFAGIAAALLTGGISYGQAGDSTLQFEVASVKLAPPPAGGVQGTRGCSGGPGSADPSRYACSNASVSLMVLDAYDLKPYQLRPAVAEDGGRFNVVAKVPAGATADQVKAMLKNLLLERFKLAFYHEKAETPGYALVVSKSGLKMKETVPPGADSAPPSRPVKDSDGFEYIPPRNRMAVGTANGLIRWAGNNIPVERLVGLLNSITGRPVINSTACRAAMISC